MISQIDISEFRKRLKTNTKQGNPKISGTPFHAFNLIGDKDKLFFGIVNQNDFRITQNAILHPIPFILKGKFKSKNENQTEISYEMIPIKFGYYWIRYFPFVAFLLFNTIFIVKKAPLTVYIIFNSFLLITSLISRTITSYKKRKFINNFRKTFEIINNE
ncbi:hypothetical protein [Flavobacterium sp.]|uniref:hypothetical protein n=1 Tax=Flavobacterium sp. TaxID=239 RepID=UPI0031DF983B